MNQTIQGRLDALRREMRAAGVGAVIIPQTDPHQGEYIADHWQVRRWLSGFTGSAGSLVVTTSEALLWADSRYFIQAAAQLEGTGIRLMKDGLPGTPSIAEYLTSTLVKGTRVGIDGMLFSVSETQALRAALEKHGLKLDVDFDPIDRIWADRPALPSVPLFVHELKYAGQRADDKLRQVLADAERQGATAALISALDEIAWTLNIRSRDVNCNPVATGYLFVSSEPGKTTLFVDPAKLTPEVEAYLKENGVATAPYGSLLDFIAALPAEAVVLIEPGRSSGRVMSALGARALLGASPVAMLKACKNDTQVEGVRAAMERDGVAMVRSLREIERRLDAGERLTELDVDAILTHFRSQQDLYFDLSFETIAGYGPHGAIVHYSANEETNVEIRRGNMLLIDSGAQYLDGTTDITRTISLGEPTPQQRHDFTLVMKGHIALGTAIYPEGTRGAQLDVLARKFLWDEGLSYLHGTGHGVGHFLNVHEGPQSIRLNDVPATLRPGMITSNEPGLYREGMYGIRCENLVLTVPAFETEFGRFYRFETLTLCPFDRQLFDKAMMTEAETRWVDEYHEMVYERLAPRLDEAERQWLRERTMPL